MAIESPSFHPEDSPDTFQKAFMNEHFPGSRRLAADCLNNWMGLYFWGNGSNFIQPVLLYRERLESKYPSPVVEQIIFCSDPNAIREHDALVEQFNGKFFDIVRNNNREAALELFRKAEALFKTRE